MIEVLINNVDALVLAFVQGAFGSLIPAIEILWRLMFIVFIALYGYKVIISGKFSGSDLIVSCLKIIVLLALATEWDMFFLFIYAMVTDMPSDLAGAIMQGVTPAVTDQASANSALSQYYDRSLEVASKLLQEAGWSDFGIYFYAFLVWFGALAFTGYAAMLIILSKLAVALLLSIAPIFILFLIFSSTKNLFEGWLRTLLNFALIPVFVYGLLALLLSIAQAPLNYMEANTGPDDALLTAIGPFIFTAIIAVLLLAQIMNIAASVTGGLSLSTMGAAAFTSRGSLQLIRGAPAGVKALALKSRTAIRRPALGMTSSAARLGHSIKNIRG